MAAPLRHTVPSRLNPPITTRAAGVLLPLALAMASSAQAYIGDSFISIPGVQGHWKGREHRNWIRIEANEWVGRLRLMNSGAKDFLAGDRLYFAGPNAARPGNPGKLVVVLGKANPDLPRMMERCTNKSQIPELTYAESSEWSRPPLEVGPRPAELPDYWEYKLKDVVVSECPVVDGAADQALILTFQNIEWLNYDPKRPTANRIEVRLQDLPDIRPVEPTAGKRVKSFLITWISPATDTEDDQCPAMNTKPSDADVFRYMSAEEVARLRARSGEKGLTSGLETELRGPNKLNVALLPGIVPDPGLHEPRITIAKGINLDGDDGRGSPPKGIRKHGNFVSPDGRTGIDNQLVRVMGCVPGFRGRKGYANQTPNARRADGNVTTVVEISGIDDEQNDESVEVALIFSMDKPIRDNAGKKFIANYTFRPTDDPNFALYNMRAHGRIVNGVVTTERIPRYITNQGQSGLLELFNVRMRFEPQPDGSMKGYLAGYEEWKRRATGSGYSECLFSYQTPALYYALKRHADGLQDPVTGEYNGISVVYEIDTVPAFLTTAPPDPVRALGGSTTASRK